MHTIFSLIHISAISSTWLLLENFSKTFTWAWLLAEFFITPKYKNTFLQQENKTGLIHVASSRPF